VGLDNAKRKERCRPEFDWANQALFLNDAKYYGRRSPVICEAAADEIVKLLQLERRPGVCVFTSYSQMKRSIRGESRARGVSDLLQGTAQRSALLRAIQEQRRAVPFANFKFLEGRGCAGRATF